MSINVCMVHCRFFVDSVPIRVFPNNERLGVPYPQKQAMKVASSIWNADNWATQGGLVKINWSHSPFISTYKRFDIDANEMGLNGVHAENGSSKWWDMPAYSSLSPRQRRMLRWVNRNYIIYDYCKDSTRFPTSPPECAGLRF